MEEHPLLLVTGPEYAGGARQENWTKTCGEPVTRLILTVDPPPEPESLPLYAKAGRIIAFPEGGLSRDAILFVSGWGAARPGALLWLGHESSIPVQRVWTACPDKKDLIRVLEQWKTDLVREKAENALQTRGSWRTPDHFAEAVEKGDESLVALFLESGLSPDLTDRKGVPLICLAAREGHTDIGTRLIEAGADVNAVSPDRNNNALMDASAGGNGELVKKLISAGSRLDIQSKNDQTALMLAVGINNPEIVEALLDAGADIDLKDVLGMTAFQYAKILGFGAIVALFEKKGTPQQKNNGSEAP